MKKIQYSCQKLNVTVQMPLQKILSHMHIHRPIATANQFRDIAFTSTVAEQQKQ